MSARLQLNLADIVFYSQKPSVIIPFSIENAFSCIFDKLIQTASKNFRLLLFNLNSIYPYSLV